ncbi:hypothetical protein VAL01S_09_00730 [Vibrio alginolyticus NBRC 15630 = ATCC 17749]|nr:hypothetical protein [Escherichia coli]BCG13650.1 hypothetical protein YZOS03_21330 [Vibrio alginolyticus]BCG16976.1 hypothetical protein HLBS07_08280 [Vibrio alginolyticus]GAD71561.1 hypothetical protein VAL01S_09_00730 [Vibrio alginolyticus NBRC 15630 = ATCC 17749]GAK16549.1 hypothetical protein JCM19053_701 [Vibrio sp. JCM 19053]
MALPNAPSEEKVFAIMLGIEFEKLSRVYQRNRSDISPQSDQLAATRGYFVETNVRIDYLW